MGVVDQRIQSLGLTIPQAAAPVAKYSPYVISGNVLYISGQIPLKGGRIEDSVKRCLGKNGNVEVGREAAKLCAINLISQMKAALGDLDRVTRVIKLQGFVQCTPEFTDHPEVIDAASELMLKVFGQEVGSHARCALGVSSLPRGVAVEIDATVEFSN